MARSTNPIRFGLNPRGLLYERIVAVTKVAEEAGFDTVSFGDRPPENNLEGWTLASAIGAQTKRIILTHSTLNVPFRNPGLLAKMAASLDVITGGGRLELTLGAGGQEPHYRAYGIEFGSPGQRFEDLEDAVAIMRGMWAGEPFSYKGRRFQVEEVKTEPRPVRGTVPIIIGAGKPRMLRYTGREAEGWIKNGGWPQTKEEYQGLLSQVEEAAEQAGRDPRTIRRVVNCTGAIGDGDLASRLPQTVGARGGLIGTAEKIREMVEEYADLGVDTFHIHFPGDGMEEQIRQFGEEVIAPLRGRTIG